MSDDQFKKDTEESLALISSSEWRHYVKFLERRVVYFQNKINDAVDKGNLVEAQMSRALQKDSEKLARSFKQQVLENKAKLKPEETKR